jgi:hypothetical protein
MGCVVDHFYVLVPNSARNLDALKKLAAHVRWVVFMLMSDNSKANARFKAFVTMEISNFNSSTCHHGRILLLKGHFF